MNRRKFLKHSALAATVGPVLGPASALGAGSAPAIWTNRTSGRAPSDTLRLAIIGAGSRGQDLMRHFLRTPGVEFSAVCDIYEPRFARAEQITGKTVPTHTDYRRLLDRAGDFDAVVVATPLGWHKDHVTAALQAGCHVYGEKSLALTPDGCDSIRNQVLESDKVFQIGLQYRYAGWYQEAVRRIHNGDIGRVTHIYAYWHRNYNWRRPVPEPGLERQINWRLYHELSGGLLAELGSHHIETANWIFGAVPERVLGSGAITFYPDGRETFDNVQAIFEYSEGRRLFFSSVIGNRKTGFQIMVYGTTGTIELTLQDAHLYYEQAAANSATPEALLNDPRYTSPTLATDGDMPYRGKGIPIPAPLGTEGDPTTRATASFVDACQTGSRPVADIGVGWGCGMAVAQAIRATRTGNPQRLPQSLETAH